MPAEIDVCAVQAPGRENRISETPIANMDELIAGVAAAIMPLTDLPYVIFGHSLGSVAAYESARALERIGSKPVLLVASGRRAPHVRISHDPIAHLPDKEFLEEITRINDADQNIAELTRHPELVELVMPVLRADFHLAETYEPFPGAKLACGVIALGGLDDEYVPESSLSAWRETTMSTFAMKVFPGGHFYLNTQRTALTDYLVRQMFQRIR